MSFGPVKNRTIYNTRMRMSNKQKQAPTLGEMLGEYTGRIEEDLRAWTVEKDTPAELADAMEYCVLGGGKRLRPTIVHMCAEAVGGECDDELLRRAATAVELVHCYSLVHDDLPEMDDDSLRRGRPTAHVKFGQAMAVLVGDALLTRAFGVLSDSDDPRAVRLTRELARAAGGTGMVAGQVADMNLCRVPDGVEGIMYIHKRKTGALITAAGRIGAMCCQASEQELAAITQWTQSLGLAYQLVDDILDATATAEQIGKTPGKDAHSRKLTGVADKGIDQARRDVRGVAGEALEKLAPLGQKAGRLKTLTRLLTERTG